MSIRLNKAIKECNVGLQTAVEFLQKKGFSDVEANPAGKITEEQYEMLLKEFTKDKGLRTEVNQMQQQRQEEKVREKEEKEREAQRRREEIIETRVPASAGPKILGKIDLNAGKKPAAPKAEEKPQPAPEAPKAAPVVEKAPEAPKAEVKPEPVVEAPKAAPVVEKAPRLPRRRRSPQPRLPRPSRSLLWVRRWMACSASLPLPPQLLVSPSRVTSTWMP